MIKKSVISLISYDAGFLSQSISKYYEYVDEIILGLDKDRISWSNKPFTFDEQQLWKDLKRIDTENKIWFQLPGGWNKNRFFRGT